MHSPCVRPLSGAHWPYSLFRRTSYQMLISSRAHHTGLLDSCRWCAGMLRCLVHQLRILMSLGCYAFYYWCQMSNRVNMCQMVSLAEPWDTLHIPKASRPIAFLRLNLKLWFMMCFSSWYWLSSAQCTTVELVVCVHAWGEGRGSGQ